jgi:phosphoribosylformylglycinamidine synthase
MFAGRLGVALRLAGSGRDLLGMLFSEELGALLQVSKSQYPDVYEILQRYDLGWVEVGQVEPGDELSIYNDDELVLRRSRTDLQRTWSELSFRMQSLRDNPATAREEFERLRDENDPGLNVHLTFDPGDDIAAPFIGGHRPRIAVLREQGVNSQHEMAAAFMRAGFDAFDLHMSDLLEGRDSLAGYQGLVACGGFSFGDVLGAGGGWAGSILYHERARDQFAAFFRRPDTFSLGVCNGCQMLARLKELIPGSRSWPEFLRNTSEQFEARLSLVEVTESASIFLAGMAGSRLPIATSHGEGRAVIAPHAAKTRALIALRYVDNYGQATERYPANPNGSSFGACGLCSEDGRVTILMPHPERVARTVQNSWHPDEWGEDGPWMRIFRNARVAVG